MAHVVLHLEHVLRHVDDVEELGETGFLLHLLVDKPQQELVGRVIFALERSVDQIVNRGRNRLFLPERRLDDGLDAVEFGGGLLQRRDCRGMPHIQQVLHELHGVRSLLIGLPVEEGRQGFEALAIEMRGHRQIVVRRLELPPHLLVETRNHSVVNLGHVDLLV